MSDLPPLPELGQGPADLPSPDLLVEIGQSMQHGWTEGKVREAVRAAVERERAKSDLHTEYVRRDDLIASLGVQLCNQQAEINRLTEEQAKAEKGLEPVAEIELIEETATEFPIELRERVRDAMRNAWVGGYNECLDEESSHHERVSPEEEAAVEAALAHPPTQVEPVASELELIEETANEFPLALRERVRDAMRNAWVGGYNECVDHPPTSEWNDAVDSAADIVATAIIYRDANSLPEIEAQIRALKREPR